MRAKNAIIMKAVQIKDRQVAKSYLILLPKLIQYLYNIIRLFLINHDMFGGAPHVVAFCFYKNCK